MIQKISFRDPSTKEIIIEDDENEICRLKVLTPSEFLEELRNIGLLP